MKPRPLKLALAVLCLFPCYGAAQENLLPNPDFDLGITGWTAAGDGELDWDAATDWEADPSSGSMIVLQTTGGTSAGSARSDCLVVAPRRDFTLGGWFHVNSGQTGTPHVQMTLTLYSGTSCSGGPLIGLSTTNIAILDAWFEKSTNQAIPADAASGRVTANAWNGNGTSFKVRADGLYLRYVPLFADGFESGDTTAWSDTVIPLAASGTKTLYDGDSYDFVTGAVGTFTGGDLYFRTSTETCAWGPTTLANNVGQVGGRFLSSLGAPLSAFTPPSDGYTRLSVCLALGDVYVYERHEAPGTHIFFRVTDVDATYVSLEFEVR